MCHTCKSHIKGNLNLRTKHRTPIELKKAPVNSWAKFLPTHCHLRSLPPMKRFAFPHWIQHLKLRALEISHLLTFCKTIMLSLQSFFVIPFMFPNYAPPGVAARALLSLCPAISFCGGCVSWLANLPLGFQHDGFLQEFDVRVFRFVLSMHVDNEQSNLALITNMALWPNG